MNEAQKDTERAMAAARAILDGRHPVKHRDSVLVTLDHVITLMLVTAMNGDARKAVSMFNEGTVPHVEERIALYASRTVNKGAGK